MSALTPIEELLREACSRGITHLTLYPVPSEDGKTVYWSARATPSTNHKYVHVSDIDPVVALRGVLMGIPKAGRRSTTRDDAPVTATVTNEPPPPQQETLDTWLPKS